MRTKWINHKSILAIILVLSGFLRFYKLGFQSFWLDELHTVIEADVSLSWQNMLEYLRCCDQHPPLFFIIEKFAFWLFGNNEFVARTVSALAGIAGVWAIFSLGKELKSPRLGIIAALLTCFNPFHLTYSQEARPYSMLFLFACLSFLYLIRVIRNPGWKNSVSYTLFTAAMLYTHYFGLFAFISQPLILFIFVFNRRNDLKHYLKHTAISLFLIVALYSPWLPHLFAMTAIKKFWIAPISPGFSMDYFYEFFGNSDLLKPLLLLFLILGSIQLLRPGKLSSPTKLADSHSLGLIICFLWIVVTYLIPFIRSVLLVPMLYPRYAIVTLPAFILILSFGVEAISHRTSRALLLSTFCFLSFIDIALLKEHYTRVHKTQFRELAAFISAEQEFSYPVLSAATAWHQQYYLKKNGYDQPVYKGTIEQQVDSIVHKSSPRYDLEGFWLSGAHGDQKPDTTLLHRLDAQFVLFRQQDFHQAWARLYVSKERLNRDVKTLDYRSFSMESPFYLNGDSVIAIWEKEVKTDTLHMDKGLYTIRIEMSGTPVSNVYPHIRVFMDENQLDHFHITESWQFYEVSFRCTETGPAVLRIMMDNDANKKGEDRNTFVKTVLISRENQ